MSERKVLTLEKASVSDTGEFTGLGAVFGNVDDGGDRINKGFFEPVLDEFLRDGFIAWMHDWGNPVAMPVAAAETGEGLQLTGQFHSHPAAQEKRLITAERIAAGKSMGLSIGYEVAADGTADGEGGVRDLNRASRLFEVSLVMVPMNRLAGVSAVKDGLRIVEQTDQILTNLRALTSRYREVARPRKEGRVLSAANRERLETLLAALAAASSDIRDLLASTDPDEGKAAAMLASMEVQYLETMARLDGHLN